MRHLKGNATIQQRCEIQCHIHNNEDTGTVIPCFEAPRPDPDVRTNNMHNIQLKAHRQAILNSKKC